MFRSIIFLLFLINCARCANHTTYKDCSRIPFCKALRNVKVSSPFTTDLDRMELKDNVYKVPLSNEEGQQLYLEISLQEKRTARIGIGEKGKYRYKLKDVLLKEPLSIPIVATRSGDSVTFRSKDKALPHKVVLKKGPSFTVEFHHDENTLQVILRGERLTFDKTGNAFAFAAEFNDAERLYGLHHHPVDLELPMTMDVNGDVKMDPYRNRNADNDGYEVGSPMAVYGTVPVLYGHSKNQTSGIFLHNAAEQWVDVWKSSSNSLSAYFMVESGALDLFVFLGKSPKDVVRQYTRLTGVAHMPQLWTLGYHQCRWSYETQGQVKDVVAKMDRYDFPMDAVWLDIDYTDGKRYFTWEPTNFSDPEEMQRNLSSTNRRLVTILDPHIKVDEEYEVYAQAKGKFFVKWANGSDFKGDCWPGLSSYLDFLDPAARDYYASWYGYDKFKHSTPVLAGIWNDMNEPSVFDSALEKTLPFETLHHGNVPHRDIHNIYGFLQTMATHQGLMQRDNGTKRPFILTRSHFSGSQRYAAMWTGDNTADWPYLQISYSECILSNIVGQVFCGADVGGFFNNPSVELLQRWYQAGIWLPFYRGHAEKTTPRREPYLYDKDVQNVIRHAIKLRYKHIPVWYTLFYEHVRTGDPIIKPIFYDYPGTVDQQYHVLLGSDILARPVMDQAATDVVVNLPGTKETYWYRVDDDGYEVYSGKNTITLPVSISTSPYFYKGGSIVARKDLSRSSTTDMKNDPFDLYINLDSNGEARGRLYVDDYTSFKYQDEGLYFYVTITYSLAKEEIHIEAIDGDGSEFTVNINKLIVHRKSSADENIYTRSVYTHLADGTPLNAINLVSKINNVKSLYLKL